MHGEVLEALFSQESGTQHFSTTVCRTSGAPGLTVSPRSGRRRGFSGTQCNRLAFLQSLDVPVPLMGEQPVVAYKLLDVMVPEQVIEVPKILVGDIPPRRLCREPQMVDQLVTVPTNPDTVRSSRVLLHRLWRTSWWKSRRSCLSLCGWVRLAAALWAYGGPLVEGGLLSHPVGPHRGTSPGQGGIEILAAATLADVVVVAVDVPVNMQHKFQQSLVLHEVHQTEWWLFQLLHRDRYAQRCCAEDR